MNVRRLLLTGISAWALAAGLLLAGCGNGDSPAASVASTAVPEPLPIEERVVKGSLGGLSTDAAPQVASTPGAFARLVDEQDADEEASKLRKADFVTGAIRVYAGAPGEVGAFGLSVALEYGSPELARAELVRLDKEFSDETREGETRGALAGVPGSRTIVASGTEGGQEFALASVFFTDGPFLHVQGVTGPRKTVRPQGVLDAANALYERVKGRPAPAP